MFFHVDEKTLKDIIENQKKREEAAKQVLEYDGHKLKFTDLPDGSVIIDADPPLVSEVKEPKADS